ncbi:hypothetical protein ABIE56_000413 [Luteibacter sp. 621]|uniref:glycoside hydrolase family 71/99-like protein n=1 Tax=Luteibacter sp. 621 TaxID=3373916 RepID=UPI003D260338
MNRSLHRRLAAALSLALPFAASLAHADSAPADASTLDGKILVGYQGWFRCPGDGSPESNFSHWSDNAPSASTINVTSYPVTTEWSAAGRCPLTQLTINGTPAYLFSSFRKETTDIHFRWMREYGVDGALIQRFTGEFKNYRDGDDAVLRHSMQAAEDNQRTFAIEYDLSHGEYYDVVSDDQVIADLSADWNYLVNTLHVTDSTAYQHQDGKPLVSLWGMGFAKDGNHVPRAALGERIIRWFKDVAHAEVMVGTPNNWEDPNRGADPDWARVLSEADIIQPWTIGAYGDLNGVEWWNTNKIIPDLALTRAAGQEYMPVVMPGSAGRDKTTRLATNDAPRLGGEFLWRQIFNAKNAGAKFVKIAMFDEVNEGTALLKNARNASEAPNQTTWINQDADGLSLPSDWYLRVVWNASRMMKGIDPLSSSVPTDPGPLDPMPECGTLVANQVIDATHPLYSCSREIRVSQDTNGDLVVYRGNEKLYSSGTAGYKIPTTVMQGDGNLVEYDTTGTPRWASGTAGHPGAWFNIRNDGVAQVVYQGKVIWQAGP